jgi:WD40 repeat protein
VRLVAELPGNEGPSEFSARPALVAFSPDSATLATAGADGRAAARLWDVGGR